MPGVSRLPTDGVTDGGVLRLGQRSEQLEEMRDIEAGIAVGQRLTRGEA